MPSYQINPQFYLVTGGRSIEYNTTATTEILDPKSGAWLEAASLPRLVCCLVFTGNNYL